MQAGAQTSFLYRHSFCLTDCCNQEPGLRGAQNPPQHLRTHSPSLSHGLYTQVHADRHAIFHSCDMPTQSARWRCSSSSVRLLSPISLSCEMEALITANQLLLQDVRAQQLAQATDCRRALFDPTKECAYHGTSVNSKANCKVQHRQKVCIHQTPQVINLGFNLAAQYNSTSIYMSEYKYTCIVYNQTSSHMDAFAQVKPIASQSMHRLKRKSMSGATKIVADAGA
eukprot:1161521-Pelagomonas_calceolata.AAC.4